MSGRRADEVADFGGDGWAQDYSPIDSTRVINGKQGDVIVDGVYVDPSDVQLDYFEFWPDDAGDVTVFESYFGYHDLDGYTDDEWLSNHMAQQNRSGREAPGHKMTMGSVEGTAKRPGAINLTRGTTR